MKYYSNRKGFTLIELLVVIAIIGILTAIVTANFAQSKAKARDAKRVSDLAQIQLTLEMAFDRCNAYPPNITNTDTSINTGVCVDSSGNDYKLSYFISVIPRDSNGNEYKYTVNTNNTDYVLRAQLETNSSILNDDVDGSPLSTDCGDASLYYCVSAK